MTWMIFIANDAGLLLLGAAAVTVAYLWGKADGRTEEKTRRAENHLKHMAELRAAASERAAAHGLAALAPPDAGPCLTREAMQATAPNGLPRLTAVKSEWDVLEQTEWTEPKHALTEVTA